MLKNLALTGSLLFAALAHAATLSPIQLLNPAGSTSGQAIVSTGPNSPPAWSNVVASSLAPVSANTVIANTTGSTAAPTAFAMPSCSTSTSALQYTTSTGFTCFAGSAPLASPAFTGTATFAARPTFAGNTPWDSGNLASPASTTGTLSQFATTTSAQLATVISNETGTGALVFGTSPTLTTPNIVGTTTNNNAAAGSVGEYASNTTTGTTLTNATGANATSVTLTAGDWDVSGVSMITALAPANVTAVFAGISTTSATAGALGTITKIVFPGSEPNNNYQIPTPTVRISLAASATVYLFTRADFTGVPSVTADGFIRARRVR